MILYRAISEAELQDLRSTGVFRPVPGTMEGKWFAVNLADLPAWIDWFRTVGRDVRVTIVEVELPDSVAAQAHFAPKLDAIGPAYYLLEPQLPLVRFVRVVE